MKEDGNLENKNGDVAIICISGSYTTKCEIMLFSEGKRLKNKSNKERNEKNRGT